MKAHHFFIPHQVNNHRAKLLHHVSLFLLVVAVGIVSTMSVFIYRTHPQVLGISYQITDAELLNLTNYERTQQGLAPLSLSKQLTEAAKKKGQHMFSNNYWAHFAPDGTSPWEFIRGEGYNYSYAGENLAKGFTTSYDAVRAWMNSPTHRENILSKNYNEVGFAIAEGNLQGEDTVLIVQEFGSRVDGVMDPYTPPESSNVVPQVNGSEIVVELPSQDIVKKPLINFPVFAKGVTFILLAALLVALIFDFLIIEKKKIPRTVGNNLDHIMLITIFIVFLFMVRLGQIV